MSIVEQIKAKIAQEKKPEDVVELDLAGIAIGKFTVEIKNII